MKLIGVNSIGAIIAFFTFIWYMVTGITLYYHIDKKYIKKSAKFRRLRIKLFLYKELFPIRNKHPEDRKYTKLIWHERISLLIILVYIIISIIHSK